MIEQFFYLVNSSPLSSHTSINVSANTSSHGAVIQHTLLFLFLLIFSTSNTHAAVLGDVAPRGCPDGIIDTADYIVIKKIVLGQLLATEDDVNNGDLAPLSTPDSKLTVGDLVAIKRISLGLAQVTSNMVTPPPAIKLDKISFNFDGTSLQVVGIDCAAESGRTVRLTNERTGDTINVIVGINSTFDSAGTPFPAQEGDQITVTVVYDTTNESESVSVNVLTNPTKMGPYPVSWVELNDLDGVNLSYPEIGSGFNSTLAWAKIMYPSTLEMVDSSSTPFPVVVFIHGNTTNHCLIIDTPYTDCPIDQRTPHHEGFEYIMEQLASRGIVAVSVSAIEINAGDSGIGGGHARATLLLQYLDILKSWSLQGTDPFSGIFNQRLDMTKIGLSGHSQGGRAVHGAVQLNKALTVPHNIIAINSIAPSGAKAPTSFVDDQNAYGEPYYVTDVALLLLQGSHDYGALFGELHFGTYDFAYPDGILFPKASAFVHGANHNYFNSNWNDDANNFWQSSGQISAEEQRNVALSTIIPFFEWQLNDKQAYRNVLTNRYRFADTRNDKLFWTYQDANRLMVDDFELDQDLSTNSLGGTVQVNGFDESTVWADISVGFPTVDQKIIEPKECGAHHRHISNGGLRLVWSNSAEYTTNIPVNLRDLSGYQYLSIRVSKESNDYPPIQGEPIKLLLNIEDATGNRAIQAVHSEQFAEIPHPAFQIVANTVITNGYTSTQLCQLVNRSEYSSIRIPLAEFERNSQLDLTNIAKIIIRTAGSGAMALDDIEVTQ